MPSTAGVRIFVLAGILFFPLSPASEKPDFGPDGLAGLSDVQIWRLSRGEVILPKSINKTPGGQTLIEAALVFDRPPEEVWDLLSKTEDQHRYIKEVKKVDVVSKESAQDLVEMTVRILGKTIVYRQAHHYDEEDLYFCWELDPSFQSEVKELNGFWRLYPFTGERTLGRYGSRVQMRFGVPSFIQNALAKNNLPSALRSIKRYIDSGWRQEKD
jgi:hypothetical protein